MFDDSSNVQFPWKLHILLTAAERNGYGHIISWLPAGNAFKVHDKTAFAEVLMPKYFHSNKYKSFQRNLNLWCFQTLTKEPNKGAIFHPHFLRGLPDRCHLIRRVKVKKNSQRVSLAEVRASAPQVNLPSASPLVPSASAADFKFGTSSLAASAQISELNAAQLMLLAQQESVQTQLAELQRQQLIQKLALLSRSTGPTIAPPLPNSLLNMLSAPSATRTHKLTGSPSNLNASLLNQLSMAQKQQQQQQVQGPPASFLIPAPSAAGNADTTTTSSELDRIKMQLSLALLVNNNNGGPPGNHQAAGIAGLPPTNPAASSK